MRDFTTRNRFRALIVVCAALLPIFAGCDSADVVEGGRVVEGIEFDELFAAPTPAERDAVLADWNARTTEAQGVQEEFSGDLTVGFTDTRVRVVSHVVAGVRHMGAIIEPQGAAPASLPVVVYLHGGDQGVSVDGEVAFILGLLGPSVQNAVVVVPSFRDESLDLFDVEYPSEGPASPWDYDVDDAMSLLTVALETATSADPARVGLIGISRGGGVALLMGERDSRVDAVVNFMGPTDFFGPFVQDVTEEALLGNPRQLPGLDYLSTTFLSPLRENELSISDLRIELARRSAVLFAERLPPTQLHHGEVDTIVPVSQAQSLISTMSDLGRTSPAFESYLYPTAGHNPIEMPFGLDRAAAYLQAELDF